MLNFKRIELSDKEIIEPYLAADGYIMSDRAFASLFIWKDKYNTQLCLKDGFLYFLAKYRPDYRTYFMPLGEGNLMKAVEEIEADSAEHGAKHRIMLVTKKRMEEVQDKISEKYVITEDRDNFDYIYNARDLVELKGKKYSAKRNYINRFKTLYENRWRYENLDPEKHRRAIHDYTLKWGIAKRGDGYQKEYSEELAAIDSTLENYDSLNIRGGILWVDDKIAAYTIATVPQDKVIDILFEKADTDIDGAYAVINNQFAINNFGDIELVNREEDLGIQGLRTAKLSYNPAFFTEKYTFIPKED